MRIWRGVWRTAMAICAAWPMPGSGADPSVTAYHSHLRPVQAVASLAADGVIATGDSGGVVYLWRLSQAETALGAELRQDGPSIGIPPAERLPGPVAGLAFGDARCDGPDNPPVSGCGLFIAGQGSAGFSYLHLYDWRRQRLLASAEVLRGSITHVAAAPGGAEVTACTMRVGIQHFRPDLHRQTLERTGERAEPPAASLGCEWAGYDARGNLHFASGDRLATVLPPPAGPRLVDEAPRNALALNPNTGAALAAAIARPDHVALYPAMPGPDAGSAPARIPTGSRHGDTGVEALAWRDGGDDRGGYLLTIGPYEAGAATETVTHQIERWRLPDAAEADSPDQPLRPHQSNFNELVALQGKATALMPLTASWISPGDPDRYRYVAALDEARRLVLVAGRSGYTKTASGQRTADPFFALEARPYARAELQIGSAGEAACLWPGGKAASVTFRPPGSAGADCRALPAPAAEPAAPPQHRPDGSVVIPPALQPLNFPGDRLRAYTLSADGRAMFAAVAVARAEDTAPVELRRYALRADRWAARGEPVPAAADVVALTLTDTATLGIALREPAGGGTYRVESRTIDPTDAAPALVVHAFVPSPTEDTAFTLCFDTRDPAQPLALYQKDGPRIRLGPPRPSPDGGRAVADDNGLLALVLESVADPACAEAPMQPGMQRFRMTVRLPFAPDGAFDLVPEGGRPEYYIINFSRPKLYILAVGIDDYYDDRWRLDYAVKDAQAFSTLVGSTQSQLYSEIETVLIRNGEANRKNILIELAKLQRKATPKDWVMIFFAGHAKSDWVYDYYFLPWDYDHTYPHSTQISEHDLAAHLRGIRGKKVLILDTCYAGNLANARIRSVGDDAAPRRLPLADVRAYAERLIRIDEGLILLAASSLDQTARESDSLGHGVFTSTLLDALRSPERFANRRYPGALSVNDIRNWIEEEVVSRSRDRQRPVIAGRADLLRAPFWQVAPQTYNGPPQASNRTRGASRVQAVGPVLWQAEAAASTP